MSIQICVDIQIHATTNNMRGHHKSKQLDTNQKHKWKAVLYRIRGSLTLPDSWITQFFFMHWFFVSNFGVDCEKCQRTWKTSFLAPDAQKDNWTSKTNPRTPGASNHSAAVMPPDVCFMAVVVPAQILHGVCRSFFPAGPGWPTNGNTPYMCCVFFTFCLIRAFLSRFVCIYRHCISDTI